jgi:2,4-dienoyl-CoA reductase-like NADH-dependent reductase (Old Yellow Enzyme family)
MSSMTTEPLFDHLNLAPGITLQNRIAMAPMTTWSSNDDATVSDEEDAYYRRRVGDVGLVITGCSHVTPNGIGFTDEFASYDDRFLPSLQRLAAAAKSGGAPAILQIFHAGSKALPSLVPDIVSASAGKVEASTFVPGGATVRALAQDEIEAIIADFAAATQRAIAAGFDGVELHGAHGFLIQNFLSPRSNSRTDLWGGSLENRMRFPLAVVAEVQRIVAAEAKRPFIVGYRISPEEHGDDGLRIEDSFVLVDQLVDARIGYIDASLGNVLADTPIDATDGRTLVEWLVERIDGSVPLMAAGQIRTPEQAAQALALGLSMIAVGQGLVMNPDWAAQARHQHEMQPLTIGREDVAPLAIPHKLWRVIETTQGWFPVREAA